MRTYTTCQREIRHIAHTVLRWYYEYEDGIVSCQDLMIFDSRLLNYRMDVERVLALLTPQEQQLLSYLHRDGLTQADAVRLVGVQTKRPDTVVAALESRLGRWFMREDVANITRYLIMPLSEAPESSHGVS